MKTTPGMISVLSSVLLSFIGFRAGAADITIDAAKTHQEIEGFGTCLISWGNYPAETYTQDFANFYSEKVGLNILRMAIGGFQHPETDDPSQITVRNMTPNSRAQIFVDFAKKLQKENPDIRLIGTVWSPPDWLKMNRSQRNNLGVRKNKAIRAHSYGGDTNRIDPDRIDHYVQWMVAVAAYYKQNGIPLYAISPANEPRFSQWYGSCVFTGEDLATVIAKLGNALESAGMGDILIFGPEDMTGHMYNGGTKSMIGAIVNNKEAFRHLDRFATHGYTDGVVADVSQESSAALWDLIKDHEKPYWMTEGGTRGHEWPEPITGGVAQALHNSLVGGNASAFVPWQISENHPSTHALAVRDTATKKTYAAMHFFRSIPIGSRRIGTSPAFGELQASAYFHPQKKELAIVLINPTKEKQTVNLQLQNLAGVSNLQTRRTSETEDFVSLPAVNLTGGRGSLELPPLSIVSLTAGGAATPALPALSRIRTWTDTEGRNIEAALVANHGETVVLRMQGKDFTLPAHTLSEKDRDWLGREHPAN